VPSDGDLEPALAAAKKEKEPEAKCEAKPAAAASVIGGGDESAEKEVAPKIRAIFNSEKDEGAKVVESYALLALGDDVEGNTKFLVAGLRSQDPIVRFRSTDCLARLKLDSAIEEMVKAFEIENRWWVRVEMDRTLAILYGERRRKSEEAQAALYPLDKPSAPKAEGKQVEPKVEEKAPEKKPVSGK